jgi:F0F1-type ATP synthase epsilon subunit
MKLTIFSSTQSQEYDINYLEVDTLVGNFVILEGHEPLVLLLPPGKPIIFCQKDTPDAFERLPLPDGGILKVTRTQSTLIING